MCIRDSIWTLAPLSRYFINSLIVAGGSTLIAIVCGIPAAYAPVSYTHLDVYKRQFLNCTEDLHKFLTSDRLSADEISGDLIQCLSVLIQKSLGFFVRIMQKLHNLMINLCCSIITTIQYRTA